MPDEWSDAPAPTRPPRRQVAVALHYEFGGQTLPTVTASGKGALAERILQLAFANGVKVRKDADLAELLGAVDVESDIPIEAIHAVAEILAYIYRANGKLPPKDSAPVPDSTP
jgi:flagellar biosynthesis protein